MLGVFGQAAGGPYAEGDDISCTNFCGKRGNGQRAWAEGSALEKLAGYVTVVSGKSQRSSDCTRASSGPANLSKIDAGSLGRESAGKKRPDSSTKTGVMGNPLRHHRSHRRAVFAAIPVARSAPRAVAAISATALATMSTAAA